MPTTPSAAGSYIVVIDNTPGLGLLNMCLFSGTSINGDLNTFNIAADLTTSLPVANRKVKTGANYVFGDGSLICQANAIGTPIGYALAMGEGALYYAKGSVSNEQIFHYDDFANSGNDAHLNAIGLQSIYGFGAYQDTRGRVPGVQLVEAVRQVPGLTLVN
jgi:hypothetical protein